MTEKVKRIFVNKVTNQMSITLPKIKGVKQTIKAMNDKFIAIIKIRRK